jgi:hypothetical protein
LISDPENSIIIDESAEFAPKFVFDKNLAGKKYFANERGPLMKYVLAKYEIFRLFF